MTDLNIIKTMEIKLPKFNFPHQRIIIACGQLDSGDLLFDDLLSGENADGFVEFFTAYKAGRREAFAAAFADKTKDRRHFHLEAFRKGAPVGDPPHDKLIDLSAFHRIISQAIGHRISVRVTSGY